MNDAAARIAGELPAEWKQALSVPFDHFGQRVDHDQRIDGRVLQRGLRGIAEPEAADDDVESASLERRQSDTGERDFRDREQARHQELVAELDFIDIEAGIELLSPAQAEHAHWRRAEIQFLEIHAHPRPAPDRENRRPYNGGFAAASLQEAHPHVLAKAGSELVEGRTLAPRTSDPSAELEEYALSI